MENTFEEEVPTPAAQENKPSEVEFESDDAVFDDDDDDDDKTEEEKTEEKEDEEAAEINDEPDLA